MKKFDLLPEIQSIHPEGIAEGERCGKPFNVLLGLPRHWQVEDLVNACERRWQPARVDIWYNLDLQGIAVVTPSVIHRDNAERGWTYTYRSGSSLALRSLMSH